MFGACVSAGTTTRLDFPRKPVKMSRAAQPVADALDRASIINACEEDTRARSSVGPRESRLRTWGRLHSCRFDDTVDVLPITLATIRAVTALLQHRSYSSGVGDSLLTNLPTSIVKEPSDQFSGESVRQPDTACRSHWTSQHPCRKQMKLGHRTVQWALRTRLSSLFGGCCGRSKQQRSFVTMFLSKRCDAESPSSYRAQSRIYKGRVHNAPTGAPALPLRTPHTPFTPWSVSKIASLPSLPSCTFPEL